MNGYLSIEEMHRLAAAGGHHDEAHSQPGFFPWHRAFVLQVERELQKIDPAVALHYWNWDAEAPNIFAADFIGGSGTSGFLSPPVFALGHPFDDWNTELPFANGAIIRNTQDHTVNPANDPAYPFVPLDDGDADDPSDFSCLVEFDDYGPFDDLNGATSFSWYAERRAHDLAHGWPCGGGHLTNPNRSACDPLFFLLHSQVDRQWAYWQSKKFRSGVVVGGALKFPAPQHYDNEGKFDDMGNAAWYKGSFEEDYMWPWDGSTGPVAGNVRASRPVNQAPAGGANVPTSRPIIPQTPFAASTIRNLWPATATAVRVRDTIDYLGKFRPSDGLGYCYDDVPY
jgi:tyrosinase